MVYFANINGIDIRAEFCDDTVRDLFVPLLKELSRMHSEKKSRILVMLAAPPGAGKSTLVSFLEYLAKGIIQYLEAKDDLFIPQYEEVFKQVLQRYHEDFRKE